MQLARLLLVLGALAFASGAAAMLYAEHRPPGTIPSEELSPRQSKAFWLGFPVVLIGLALLAVAYGIGEAKPAVITFCVVVALVLLWRVCRGEVMKLVGWVAPEPVPQVEAAKLSLTSSSDAGTPAAA
jgi:hypothetical protein